MASGPNVKTSFQKLFDDTLTRVTLLERRVAIGGSGGGGGGEVPYDANPGMIMPYAGTTAPTGWLLCDGSAVSRSTYSALFGAIGTAYGAGDGSTTFNLPNLKGKVPYGKDAAQTEFDVLGEAGGAKTHTLTVAEMPSHTHLFEPTGLLFPWYNKGGSPNGAAQGSSWGFSYPAMPTNTATVAAGGGGAHNNLPPYVVTNYIISTGQGVGGGGTQSSGGGGGTISAGIVSPYAGVDSAVPTGWLLCDGRLVQRTQYPALFAAIGVTYGAGDGTTTFGLPNYKGRTLVGLDGSQAEFDVLGEVGGAKTHTHGASHSHTLSGNGYARVASDVSYLWIDNLTTPLWTADRRQTGAGASVTQTGIGSGAALGGTTDTATPTTDAGSSLQPYAVANWIISTGAGSNPVTPVVPVPLWQEFKLASPGGLRPLSSGAIAWDGVSTGNLGLVLDAAKRTITFPEAGTYRVVQHVGIATSAGGAANMNAIVNGAQYNPSLIYGTAGPAGAFNVEAEFVLTSIAAGTTMVFVANAPAGGVYDWSWLRIEKSEPFYAKDALTVQQGSTVLRDAIYGIPATDAEKVSLANRMITWFNTDKGWQEVYYATTATVGLIAKGLATGFPAGWYPIAGALPFGEAPALNDLNAGAGEVRVTLTAREMSGGITFGSNALVLPIGGRYEVSAHLYHWTSTGSYRGVQVFDATAGTVYASGTTNANWDNIALPRRSRIMAGVSLGVRTSGDAAQTVRGQQWPAIEVQYIGPPLANG